MLSSMARYLALVLLFACGCSAGVPTTYTVTLDPSLSPELAQSALDAAEEWQAAVPGLELSVRMAPCGVEDASYGTICVMAQSGPSPLGADIEGNTARSVSVVWPEDFRTDSATRVIAHELGHAMGLVHTGEGTLMCATSVCAAGAVTAADVAQWESLR